MDHFIWQNILWKGSRDLNRVQMFHEAGNASGTRTEPYLHPSSSQPFPDSLHAGRGKAVSKWYPLPFEVKPLPLYKVAPVAKRDIFLIFLQDFIFLREKSYSMCIRPTKMQKSIYIFEQRPAQRYLPRI